MAYSKVVTEGDGSTTIFAVNFAMDYLLESDVTCRVGTEVDGSGDPLYRAITFVDTNLIQIGGAVVGDGVPIVFERTVDKNELRVDFNNGDVMDETNLGIMQKQLMMAVHELLDGRTGVQAVDVNAGGYRIINLGNPINATDATNKSYVDGLIATGQENVATTVAAKNAAEAAAAAAAVVYDNFDDRYLGSKTVAPTVDNDGAPLTDGVLYFHNATPKGMRVYFSGAWGVAYNPAVGAVDSVFGRVGGVVAANGDYTATQITNTPAGNIAATTVQAALNELDSEKVATSAVGTAAAKNTGTSGNTVPLLDGRNSYTKQQNIAEVALTDLANTAWDCDNAVVTWAVGGARVLNTATNQVAGGIYTATLTNSTGTASVAFNSSLYKGVTGYVLTAGVGKIDELTWRSNGTVMRLIGVRQDIGG